MNVEAQNPVKSKTAPPPTAKTRDLLVTFSRNIVSQKSSQYVNDLALSPSGTM